MNSLHDSEIMLVGFIESFEQNSVLQNDNIVQKSCQRLTAIKQLYTVNKLNKY